MNTIAVEYHLSDGKLIQAREQNGANGKKYPVGTELEILPIVNKNLIYLLYVATIREKRFS